MPSYMQKLTTSSFSVRLQILNVPLVLWARVFGELLRVCLLYKMATSQNCNTFTKMADVYSYAMTCYEVLRGCIPFEGHPRSDYSRVLSGKKPKMLDYIQPLTGALLAQCWHPNNLQMFISMCKYCLRIPPTRCKR